MTQHTLNNLILVPKAGISKQVPVIEIQLEELDFSDGKWNTKILFHHLVKVQRELKEGLKAILCSIFEILNIDIFLVCNLTISSNRVSSKSGLKFGEIKSSPGARGPLTCYFRYLEDNLKDRN